MQRKKKFALISMAVIVALSLVAFGLYTTVFAQDSEDNGSQNSDNVTPYETFIGKVADKLGLEYDVVYNAIQEAHQEMIDEAVQERLQDAVDEGLITQEQADQILQWIQNRPDALDQLGGFGLPGGLLGGGRIMGGGRMMGEHHRCGW